MQNVVAIGCFFVLVLVGLPFAIQYPWRVGMAVAFLAVHVAAMVGYAALIGRLARMRSPAARGIVAAHEKLSALLGDAAPYDGPRHKVLRVSVQLAVYLPAFAFYVWLLASLGGVLDWLEGVPAEP